MKLASVTAALALGLGLVTAAAAQPAAAPAAPAAAAPAAKKYSIDSSPLLDLMKDAKTKPILQKHLADFYGILEENAGQIPPDFTLNALADAAQGMVSPEALKAIQADFDKL